MKEICLIPEKNKLRRKNMKLRSESNLNAMVADGIETFDKEPFVIHSKNRRTKGMALEQLMMLRLILLS